MSRAKSKKSFRPPSVSGPIAIDNKKPSFDESTKIFGNSSFEKERLKFMKRQKGRKIKKMIREEKLKVPKEQTKEEKLAQKQISNLRKSKVDVVTTDSGGHLLVGRKLKLKNFPESISDTSTLYELKAKFT